MSRLLLHLGRFAARRPVVTIVGWIALAAIIIGSSAAFGGELDDRFGVAGSDSDRAMQVLARTGADASGLTAQVVLTPVAPDGTFAQADARRAANEVRTTLAALPNVLGVSTVADGLSENGRVALLRLQYPPLERVSAADLTRLKQTVASERAGTSGRALQIEAAGELFFAFETPEGALGEVVGVAVAAVILMVAFGSLIAMGLPIILALVGLGLGMSALPLVTHLIAIPSWAPMMAAMVGLGVGIDYALLMVSRHREHLAQGMSVDESIARTVATAGRSVVFAGGTVLVAILGLAVAGLQFITAAGVGISVVVLMMVSASVTLLPALLRLAGPWINRLSIHRRGRNDSVESRWERWGTHVTRHARAYLVGGTLTLLALGAPALALRLGTPDDGTLPTTRTERRAYDLVASGFGPGSNGPFLVVVDTAGDPNAAASVRRTLAADRGIASVSPQQNHGSSGVVSMLATPLTSPQDVVTRDTLARVRSDVLPDALRGSRASAFVGGQTAVFVDTSDRVADRLFAFVAAVVGLSLLLLIFVFRSIVVPIKAAAMNLLSIGAAYGVMVMVFQWGWGASLIGVHSSVPIVSFIPMFMFAIVFGLSMDYEVFLLSRVREHYLATGDSDASVVHGLGSTARVITSAAMIMVAVFLGFISGSDPSTKMFGLGLASAIFIDATIVRMVLVPATMKLLGSANWWLPAWLDRRLPGRGHVAMSPTPVGTEAG